MDKYHHAQRIAEIRADHSRHQELPKVAHHRGIKHIEKNDYELIDKKPKIKGLNNEDG